MAPPEFDVYEIRADSLMLGSQVAVSPPHGRNFAGFAYGAYDPGRKTARNGSWTHDWQQTLSVPHWFVIAGSGVLPALWFRRRRRTRYRLRHGLCPSCGYDLRASPGRCPECGPAVADSQG